MTGEIQESGLSIRHMWTNHKNHLGEWDEFECPHCGKPISLCATTDCDEDSVFITFGKSEDDVKKHIDEEWEEINGSEE